MTPYVKSPHKLIYKLSFKTLVKLAESNVAAACQCPAMLALHFMLLQLVRVAMESFIDVEATSILKLEALS